MKTKISAPITDHRSPITLPRLMGILNVTPDSFYDGGRYLSPEAAERLRELADDGADLIDIGAESSRPGSARISADEELGRLRPIFQVLRNYQLPPISIDTTKSKVAKEAFASGAAILNDISGLRHDPDGMLGALNGFSQSRLVLMHMKGDPQTMQMNPDYQDVFGEIAEFFEERLRFLEKNGISGERVILDPGIGFGKKLEHNLEILRRIPDFKKRFGRPVLIGASRKSMIGMILDGAPPEERLEGSLTVAVWCAEQGVDYLRVHDVKETWRALKVRATITNSYKL
ncbi:MAG: dihydropteroate synthase [Elusimicrobia bacterium]|nr:dihydropteroate synthase [Elusimicrobiota bacterium]